MKTQHYFKLFLVVCLITNLLSCERLSELYRLSDTTGTRVVQGNDEAVKSLKRIESERVAPPVGQHYYGISHDKQLENFFNTILGKEKLKVSIEDGIRTLHGVNMIYTDQQSSS